MTIFLRIARWRARFVGFERESMDSKFWIRGFVDSKIRMNSRAFFCLFFPKKLHATRDFLLTFCLQKVSGRGAKPPLFPNFPKSAALAEKNPPSNPRFALHTRDSPFLNRGFALESCGFTRFEILRLFYKSLRMTKMARICAFHAIFRIRESHPKAKLRSQESQKTRLTPTLRESFAISPRYFLDLSFSKCLQSPRTRRLSHHSQSQNQKAPFAAFR